MEVQKEPRSLIACLIMFVESFWWQEMGLICWKNWIIASTFHLQTDMAMVGDVSTYFLT